MPLKRQIRRITFLLLGLCLLMTGYCPPLRAEGSKEKFETALPGYGYSFPRDHGAHENYRTEWWYYTGHLKSGDGRTFGYQLTFFRSGMDHPSLEDNPSRWAPRHLYLAHFAITDERNEQFHYTEKVNRAGIGNAGAGTGSLRVWNGNWAAEGSIQDMGEVHHLAASEGEMGIDLWLAPLKPPVIHGENGISKKGPGPTQASHYYSLTRMDTRGTLRIGGRSLEVTGSSWMDHEFGSNQLSEDQAGWDWFGIQMDHGIDLMLFQIRKKDPGTDPFSGGTIIAPDGRSQDLKPQEFRIRPRSQWKSPKSGGIYPSGWEISIPGREMTLTLTPTVLDQELITYKSTGITYWEGSVRVSGTQEGKSISGRGYAELTGYAGQMNKEF